MSSTSDHSVSNDELHLRWLDTKIEELRDKVEGSNGPQAEHTTQLLEQIQKDAQLLRLKVLTRKVKNDTTLTYTDVTDEEYNTLVRISAYGSGTLSHISGNVKLETVRWIRDGIPYTCERVNGYYAKYRMLHEGRHVHVGDFNELVSICCLGMSVVRDMAGALRWCHRAHLEDKNANPYTMLSLF